MKTLKLLAFLMVFGGNAWAASVIRINEVAALLSSTASSGEIDWIEIFNSSPVAVDATHMVRIPGPSSHEKSGGQPQFIPTLALAATAAGCDALFLEVHPDPSRALCDATSQLFLKYLRGLLETCLAVRRALL